MKKKNFVTLLVLVCSAIFVMPSFAINKELLKQAKLEKEAEAVGLASGIKYPIGPGDRDFMAKVKLERGETTSNIEVWVLYSDNKTLVENSSIGDQIPQGKSKIISSDDQGLVSVGFIFPHSAHPEPNSADVHPKIYTGGKKIYYKLIKKKKNSQFPYDIVEFVMPEELTIAIMGDSFASGEGAPYKNKPFWDNERAHRSKNSSKAYAVTEYINTHPETAIALINVSSSGAGINEGIIESQIRRGWLELEQHGEPVRSQILQVKDWMSKNDFDKLNIIMISVGINEIFFSGAVQTYFIGPGALDLDMTARKNIDFQIDELEIGYNSIKDNFERSFLYDRVHVSEYPDLTHWKNKKFCGKPDDVGKYGSCWNFIEISSGVPEYKIAHAVLLKMNSKIKETIGKIPNWFYVEGARKASLEHGLCNCDEPWFNTIGASYLIQGDPFGTFHPTRVGHAAFMPFERDAIAVSVSKLRTKHMEDAVEAAKQVAKEEALQEAKEKNKKKARALLSTDTPLVPAPTPMLNKRGNIEIPPAILQKIGK